MFMTVLFITIILSLLFTAYIFFFFKVEPKKREEIYDKVRDPRFLKVLVPRDNDKGAATAAQLFTSLHGIINDSTRSTDLFSLEIFSDGKNGVGFYVVTPSHLAKFVEGQIYSHYPQAVITLENDPAVVNSATDSNNDQVFITAGEFKLDREFVFPIKSYKEFDTDPLNAVMATFDNLAPDQSLWFQILLRPIADQWHFVSNSYLSGSVENLSAPRNNQMSFGKFLSDMSRNLPGGGSAKRTTKQQKQPAPLVNDIEAGNISKKTENLGFEFAIRVVCKANDRLVSEQMLRSLFTSFKQYGGANFNSFAHDNRDSSGEQLYNNFIDRFLTLDPEDLVNSEELASIYHFPTGVFNYSSIKWGDSKRSELPTGLPSIEGDEEVTPIAENEHRGVRRVVGIKDQDRKKHIFLLGKSSTGKSSTMKNMLITDMLRGKGLTYIDLDGREVDELLQYIPPHRINDVVYLNLSDLEKPFGFNIFDLPESDKELLLPLLLNIFKCQLNEYWGPKIEYVTQKILLTAFEVENTNILSITRMLTDQNYREFIISKLSDLTLLNFWKIEIPKFLEESSFTSEVSIPIRNRLDRFTSSTSIRNVVSQSFSTLDFDTYVGTNKIILVNLDGDKIGKENSALLGDLLLARLLISGRKNYTSNTGFKSHNLYLDNFHRYSSSNVDLLITEGNNLGLSATLSNRYLEQLDPRLQNAIVKSVGTIMIFNLAHSDAEIMEREFAPLFGVEDMVSLEPFSVLIRLSIDGSTSKPFLARSIDFKEAQNIFGKELLVKESSTSKYTRKLSEIEKEMKYWLNSSIQSVIPTNSEDEKSGFEISEISPIPQSSISQAQYEDRIDTQQKPSAEIAQTEVSRSALLVGFDPSVRETSGELSNISHYAQPDKLDSLDTEEVRITPKPWEQPSTEKPTQAPLEVSQSPVVGQQYNISPSTAIDYRNDSPPMQPTVDVEGIVENKAEDHSSSQKANESVTQDEAPRFKPPIIIGPQSGYNS